MSTNETPYDNPGEGGPPENVFEDRTTAKQKAKEKAGTHRVVTDKVDGSPVYRLLERQERTSTGAANVDTFVG